MKSDDDAKPNPFRGKAMTVVVQSDLSLNAKMVAMVLLSHWSEKRPRPFPGVATIAREGSMCERSARNGLRELEQVKGIETRKRRQNSLQNEYIILGLEHLAPRETGTTCRSDTPDQGTELPAPRAATTGTTCRSNRHHMPPLPAPRADDLIQGSDPGEVTHGSGPLARADRARDAAHLDDLHGSVSVDARVSSHVDDPRDNDSSTLDWFLRPSPRQSPRKSPRRPPSGPDRPRYVPRPPPRGVDPSKDSTYASRAPARVVVRSGEPEPPRHMIPAEKVPGRMSRLVENPEWVAYQAAQAALAARQPSAVPEPSTTQQIKRRTP